MTAAQRRSARYISDRGAPRGATSAANAAAGWQPLEPASGPWQTPMSGRPWLRRARVRDGRPGRMPFAVDAAFKAALQLLLTLGAVVGRFVATAIRRLT